MEINYQMRTFFLMCGLLSNFIKTPHTVTFQGKNQGNQIIVQVYIKIDSHRRTAAAAGIPPTANCVFHVSFSSFERRDESFRHKKSLLNNKELHFKSSSISFSSRSPNLSHFLILHCWTWTKYQKSSKPFLLASVFYTFDFNFVQYKRFVLDSFQNLHLLIKILLYKL